MAEVSGYPAAGQDAGSRAIGPLATAVVRLQLSSRLAGGPGNIPRHRARHEIRDSGLLARWRRRSHNGEAPLLRAAPSPRNVGGELPPAGACELRETDPVRRK